MRASVEVPKNVGYFTAVTIVVATMVGTGVFTTLGLQAVEIQSGFALLAIWATGGLIALCGALSYAELAAALPGSGGEYHYLTEIFHPVLGVVAGWVSVVVGFAAPIALAAMALGRYASAFTSVSPATWAIGSVLIVTVFHVINVRIGLWFQVFTTALKLLLILSFCALGLIISPRTSVSFLPSGTALGEVFSTSFGVSLIYVSYAFSGWNAATYVAGEVRQPERTLPRALLHGTLIVTALYLLLNLVFLRSIPMDQLAGKVEVGALAAGYVFGPEGGLIMSVMICVLLVSSISAMALAGPRVIHRAGQDLPGLRFLAVNTRGGAPYRAILLQQLLALVFVLTDSFEQVLSYAGFTLNLFALMTVVGLTVLRRTAPDLHRPYRAWGYPWTSAIFIILSAVSLVLVLWERPLAATAGILTILVGLIFGLVHGGSAVKGRGRSS